MTTNKIRAALEAAARSDGSLLMSVRGGCWANAGRRWVRAPCRDGEITRAFSTIGFRCAFVGAERLSRGVAAK